jgi:hypothetical protein
VCRIYRVEIVRFVPAACCGTRYAMHNENLTKEGQRSTEHEAEARSTNRSNKCLYRLGEESQRRLFVALII